MNYVVDASVSVKWYIPEIYEQEAARLLKGRHSFHVPEIILPEFSNIIWKKVRRGEITNGEDETIISAFSRKNGAFILIKKSSNRLMRVRKRPGKPFMTGLIWLWQFLCLANL